MSNAKKTCDDLKALYNLKYVSAQGFRQKDACLFWPTSQTLLSVIDMILCSDRATLYDDLGRKLLKHVRMGIGREETGYMFED